MGRPKKVIDSGTTTEEIKKNAETGTFKMTFFKTKNGKDWMVCERYKVVISPPNERVKIPKGFTKIPEWTEIFNIDDSSYDFTEDMKTGYITFQGDVGYFPPTHFVYPKIDLTTE